MSAPPTPLPTALRADIPTPGCTARLALATDASVLDAWLQARDPLGVLAGRARGAALAELLARPERGVCIVVQRDSEIAGVLVAMLLPSIAHAGLVALASEWLPAQTCGGADDADGADGAAMADGVVLVTGLQALSDWCAAHGVRHIQMTPGLHRTIRRSAAPLAIAFAGRFAQGDDGLWHRTLVPAPKQLA